MALDIHMQEYAGHPCKWHYQDQDGEDAIDVGAYQVNIHLLHL